MSIKLFDVACVKCETIYPDRFIETEAEEISSIEECTEPCQAKDDGTTCGPFKTVISVSRASKHSSWEVR